jgi:rhamnosyltransferase
MIKYRIKRYIRFIFNICNKTTFPLKVIFYTIANKINKSSYTQYQEIKADVNAYDKDIICIFAHFSKDIEVADYVIMYLKELYSQGCATIFVSTAKKITELSLSKIKPYVVNIIIRKNIGLDFGSFYTGYQISKIYTHHKYLLLANDSVFGPIVGLDPIFEMVKKSDCDVLGYTDSWEQSYHLQSYFLIFTKKVFTDEVFETFWKNFQFSNNKQYIIKKCEIGLSSVLINKGFNLRAFCNYFDLADKYNNYFHYINPTHHYWKRLITDFKYPFIKKELILYNPSRIRDIYLWRKILKEKNYPIELIEKELKK